ncbi:MAG: pyruvate dehydrogenase (acetyl-transferring) E1 component subunit alpha [Nitrospiraceae bacterium]|nr:pyruvate dehydrogenase (acetyl-transferring) E1 component subunit alpha [Nitrospiraceae bacterium]
MPERIVETVQVKHLRILDKKGNADPALAPPLSDEELKRMYEILVLSRTFDQRALNLQREGRLGTYPSFLGQEASQVGSAFAAEKSDWLFPTFRESGVYVAMGCPLHLLFQYWGGDERGMRMPDNLNVFPLSIPVGTQITHAVGVAMAIKYRKDRAAALAYFGDGGSSRGDFHEGLNMAGVFKLPVVFLCQNNQWAISMPRDRQTAAQTIAQKAWAYGFEGIQVDGNDVFAVYKATRDALMKAKGGGGPTLIECFTYRVADHTTSDDASRYRTKEELEIWKARDPILRLRMFMEKKSLWSDAYQKDVETRSKAVVDEAQKKAEAIALPDPRDMFTYTYNGLSQRQSRQLKDF